jgi:adenosylmethionine-8-amino-7-oxononanoate aminotransferase
MEPTTEVLSARTEIDTDEYRTMAATHLWRGMTNYGPDVASPPLIFVQGEGCYLIDSDGKRYLDVLSNMSCVNLGYSYGEEIGEAALEQYRRLPFQQNWFATSTPTIELAAKLATLTPEGLDRVFFSPSGGEAVEAAWKLARNYHRIRGKNKWKAIARTDGYHGTTMGALALIGISELRTQFEPLTPQAIHVPGAYPWDRAEGQTEEEHVAALLADLESRILAEDPTTIGLFISEPVYNRGGITAPVAGYFDGVRALCDKYDILFAIDETISGFGRVGDWFATNRYGICPDIITCAKGLSSAHAVIGATIVRNEIFDTFREANAGFSHGMTYGGHPVMAAVALKNIEIMERLDIPGRVRAKEGELRAALEGLGDLDVVTGVSGAGFMLQLNLATTASDGRALTTAELDHLYGAKAVGTPLREAGVLTAAGSTGNLKRPNDRAVLVMLPLVADTPEFDVLVTALRDVLTPVDERYRALR